MKTIYCMNPISPKGLSKFTQNYQISDNLDSANAILVRSATMLKMSFTKELECIARAGAGVNNIPLDQCSNQGIVVFNTPGANANGVKELVVAGMLLSCRDILAGVEWCKANRDDLNIAKNAETAKKKFAGDELHGKTLGIIGLGAIGAKVANVAIDLGMRVIGYDPLISINAAWSLSRKVQRVSSLDEIYAQADYISLHIPLTPDTKELINQIAFDKMKKGSVLLNFSRDGLVKESALKDALESNTLRKYVTDFPTPTIMHLTDVIVIPHLGASTEESEENCAIMAVDECMDYLENGNIKNSVNFPTCDMGICKSASRICILHKNIPNMLGQITQKLAEENVNISNLVNNSKNQVTYTLLDLETIIDKDVLDALEKIEGISKVRIIQ